MRWVEERFFELREGEAALVGISFFFGLFKIFCLNKPKKYIRLPWEQVIVYKVWAH